MRKLSEAELLSLTSLLKMEQDGLVVQRAVNALITDENLRRQVNLCISSRKVE